MYLHQFDLKFEMSRRSNTKKKEFLWTNFCSGFWYSNWSEISWREDTIGLVQCFCTCSKSQAENCIEDIVNVRSCPGGLKQTKNRNSHLLIDLLSMLDFIKLVKFFLFNCLFWWKGRRRLCKFENLKLFQKLIRQ